MNIKNKHPKVDIENITPEKGHFFFGFYDITPWDGFCRRILSHRSEFIDRMPEGGDEVEVGFIENKHFNPIDRTSTWNFQQGARLQWVPGSDNEVIYNVRNNSGFGSRICDLKSGKKTDLAYPIYALSPNGDTAISLNFSRLQRLGGYGYAGFKDLYESNLAPDDDGIFKIDIRNNSRELIISLSQVADLGMKNKNSSHHYFTHPTFNPSGNRFCFLHRFKLDDGGLYTRLLTANPDGSDLFVVAEGTLSHFDWFDENHILIWGRSKSYLTKARKHKFFTAPVFKFLLNILRKQVRGFVRHKIIGDQYLLFEDKTKSQKSLGKGVLTEDGHPTRFNNTPWIVTDTYPDENHYRSLILYNLESNNKIELGKFYSLPDQNFINNYSGNVEWDLSGMRSDLHPRWDRTGNKVCIDSVHDGKKNIYVINLENIINENS